MIKILDSGLNRQAILKEVMSLIDLRNQRENTLTFQRSDEK